FPSDSRRLISAGLDGIRFWNLPEGNLIRSFTGFVYTPSFALTCNKLGTALATIGGGKAMVWDEPFDNRPSQFFDVPDDGPRFIAISPNGKTLTIPGP